MNSANTVVGWFWVKRGFILFSRQPVEMLTLFLAYMFLNVCLGFIPFIGQLLPVLLIPVFAMGFMQACRQIDDGVRVYPNVLLAGFRSESFMRLLGLGSLYLLAIMFSILISQVFDGGDLYTLLTSSQPVDAKKIEDSRLAYGVLGVLISFLPALMAFWFAGPLIMWRKMSIVKAMFFSFVSVKRAWKAFFFYGFAWLLIGGFLPVLILQILASVVDEETALVLLMMPVLALLTTVRYCSFYPTYLDTFGKPE
jgi:hypothetical protein